MNILNYLIPVAQANSGGSGSGCQMFSDYGFMGMGGGYMGGIFAILFWVVVIAGIIYLIRSLFHDQSKKQDKTPKEILEERYAKGEIGEEEFERKKEDLS